MDFLKEILGEELFAQFAEKINAHNGNEANKDKQIKIANLGGGEYVSKAKYDALQALFDSKDQELTAANGLIDGFKKSQKDNEAVQGQITGYEAQISQLQEQLKQTQLEAAIKVALVGAKTTDVDYMTFRLKEKGDLQLDDQGNIKGIDDMLAGLKTQFPAFFESASAGKQIDPQKLPDHNNTGGTTVTKEEFNKMGYASRVELKQSNPEAYAALMKG